MSISPDAREWVLPTEPTPVRLMNTIWADTRGVHDDLTTAADLTTWLTAVGKDGSKADAPHELGRARMLRDALRRLAAYTTNDPRPPAVSAQPDVEEAIRAVNSLLADLPAEELSLNDGRLERADRADASPTAVALATIATDAVALFAGPDATRLRACLAPSCVLYFVKSHPRREWCSEACGNRARAARHYQRLRTRRAAGADE